MNSKLSTSPKARHLLPPCYCFSLQLFHLILSHTSLTTLAFILMITFLLKKKMNAFVLEAAWPERDRAHGVGGRALRRLLQVRGEDARAPEAH